jgi:hypothetical protein
VQGLRLLAALVILCSACYNSLRASAIPGVSLIDGGMGRDGVFQIRQKCSASYEKALLEVALETLAEVRRRGLLTNPSLARTSIVLDKPIGVLWTPELLSKTKVLSVPLRKSVTPTPDSVVPQPPLGICIVDQAPPIQCGIPVYGCAIPKRNSTNIFVAGQHAVWERTLIHEILCSLAYVGQMSGWPREEADVIVRSDYRDIINVVASKTGAGS